MNKRTRVDKALQSKNFNSPIFVQGWVRSKRGNKNIVFISVNDGSIIHNIQVVVDVYIISEKILQDITTGAAIGVRGNLVESAGKGQNVEIQAEDIIIYGKADNNSYPLQKKGHSLEFLREIAHLRSRTNTFGAVFRIRHAMSYAIHTFFNNKGFYYVHTPIITGSDCEGAGHLFNVTAFDLKKIPYTKEGQVDFEQDFFGKSTYLTVSGQLEAETVALALSNTYTFGPTFRAENSNTHRHLAEFWMVEPEVAFYDINDNMDLAEEFLKYLVGYALDNCSADVEFLNNTYDNELLQRLNGVIDKDFVRLTYSDAVDILKKAEVHFEFLVNWGSDLQSEHERYLTETHFKKPVIIVDYPKAIKAFYMKENEDGKTVRAMDVLFPKIGEIIGGSQREEDYLILHARIQALKLQQEHMQWYLDTRRFGSVPHSGFGLGLERLLLFITGMSNIRDVIPFPRTPKNAEF